MTVRRAWLALTVVVAMVATVLVGAPPVADAASCPPPGGADSPFVADPAVTSDKDVAVVGGGWGHGVGMSQYGAQGAALSGCDYRTILGAYYPGTHVDDQPSPPVVRVGLLDPRSQANGATVAVTAEDGDVRWEVHPCSDPAIGCTGSGTTTQVGVQGRGSTWNVRASSSGAYVITDAATGAEVFRGGDMYAELDALHDGTVVKIATPTLTRRSRWGFTRFDSVSDGKLYVVEHITGGNGASAIDRYLWGLEEVPASWHVEALKSQALAGRSYAHNRIGLASRQRDCRCDLYPTTADQHWTGWQREHDDQVATGGRWKTAVTATAGQVPRYRDPVTGAARIVEAFYSSSHGGWSDSALDVWGTEVPYLKAVDTSNWERAANNPRQRWTVGFTNAELAARFQLASFESLTVETRGAGGRPTTRDLNGDSAPDGAKVVGTVRKADGTSERVTRWLSGEQLRWKLGLYSALVHVQAVPRVPTLRLQDLDNRHRIGTSVAMSRHGWPQGAGAVVVARADEPADALAGAALAGKLHAPLLITGSEALHPLVSGEVARLGATAGYMLGGDNALSPQVAADLRRAGVNDVQRLSGPTRVETAAAIARRLQPIPAGAAYLVFSAPAHPRSWPDALAVSGPAARLARAGTPRPVLVTGASVPEATWQVLRELLVREVVLVGGEATIPASVRSELEARGFSVRRLAGRERYATSRAVAEDVPAPAGTLLVATGDNFPDGLSAGALAGRLDVTFILVPGGQLDEDSRAWVRALRWGAPRLLVAGGAAAVSDATVGGLQAALAP
ncbi:MAG: cell wall-binding repeat-containing protein [Actinomycetota bacterium]|nr:cell wall-binding repeat-containing protein [Actinomycetota bacterium]